MLMRPLTDLNHLPVCFSPQHFSGTPHHIGGFVGKLIQKHVESELSMECEFVPAFGRLENRFEYCLMFS